MEGREGSVAYFSSGVSDDGELEGDVGELVDATEALVRVV